MWGGDQKVVRYNSARGKALLQKCCLKVNKLKFAKWQAAYVCQIHLLQQSLDTTSSGTFNCVLQFNDKVKEACVIWVWLKCPDEKKGLACI